MVDPDDLIENADTPSSTKIIQIEPGEASEYRDIDSHVAVGITNSTGEVLLADDGSHGLGLPARAVNQQDEWLESANGIVEQLFENPECDLSVAKVRRNTFSVEGKEEEILMYNVVFEADVSVEELSESGIEQSRYESVEWSSAVPVEQEGAMAEDIRLFL